MRLSHIKIAGFKSFVDPAHITLPGQIVGIVGPNGCGKSNIIDALRWVLGESRASVLRGDSMQDVIFNGSSKRKPVSRASVELIFDNSRGKSVGQWSGYSEISIKRVLLRDGNSSYHINNQHVRRKDVTDIFLGTGLGARAYAIIEQGMISRIIEARPEELRMFLEEAAGVSRYRDRRRETELRIADTQGNLLRVDDILQELTHQLAHLEIQAAIAMQYRELQSKRDTAQKLLWLLNKQESQIRQHRFSQALEKTKNELEAESARMHEMENQLESMRNEHYVQSDALHARQGDLYAVNAEIARLEQQLAYSSAQRTRLTQQLANNRQQIKLQQEQLHGIQSSLNQWQKKLEEACTQVADQENRVNAETCNLPQAEEAARDTQALHNSMQLEQMALQQQLQLAQTQCEHIQLNMQRLEARRERLLLEREHLPPVDQEALAEARRILVELECDREERQLQLAQLQACLSGAHAERNEQRTAMQEQEREQAQAHARLSALEELQEQADHDNRLKQWLARHQLHQHPRLWQSIRIEPGWEDAIEAVLRERVNALALPRLEDAAYWEELPPSRFTIYEAEDMPLFETRRNVGLLPFGQFVRCQDTQTACVMANWLSDIYATESIVQGLSLRRQLPAGAWFVTPEGHLIGTCSILFHAPDNHVHGILARQREMERLLEVVQQLELRVTHSQRQTALAEESCRDIENRIALLRAMDSELQKRQHKVQVDILKLTQAGERSQDRTSQINFELKELSEQSASEKQHFLEIRERMEMLHETIEVQQRETEQVKLQMLSRESELRLQREKLQELRNELQEARFLVKTCMEKSADLNHNLTQTGLTIAQLESMLIQTQAELDQINDEPDRQQLQESLENRQAQEQAMVEMRNQLEQTTRMLSQQEQARLSCEQKLPPLREKINEWSLKEQEARLQYEHWAEQLQGMDETTLLPMLAGANLKPDTLHNELIRLDTEIAGLGAVNLAALEELQSCQERKTYLDIQAKDLNEAMDTLQKAIRRIDKESRDLLMSTYDEVNRHLAELFPVLFGGGEARLVLTGGEILDSGIQVMAHPPGKKNSSIHLLSGGEKALTALALVFAMFHLNPAPFCLLDEVDAPLDDTNTERLCKLITKMAENTQFIFISHNKITMELAQQLVGITMQERGVSHVVSVDIEEALRLRTDSAITA